MVATTQPETPADWPDNYGTKTLIDWQFRTAAETKIPPYIADPPKRTGPQGRIEPFTVVEDPAAWYAADMEKDKSWLYELTEEDIAELDAAIAGVEAKGLDIKEKLLAAFETLEVLQDVTKADFPLPKLESTLKAIGHNVSHGKGFHMLRKIPVLRYTNKQAILAAWGLGLYWGNHQVQDKLGQLISHVKDNGTNPNGFNTRAYTTSSAQPLHNDNADIVGLLCVRPAKEGGHSHWSSQITAHNEMLLRGRKDLVEVLADGQWWLHKDGWNCGGGGIDKYYNHPVFSYHDGYLSCSLQGAFYFKSQSNPAVPKITSKEIEALRLYTALSMSNELRMDWELQPGDLQLLHNCSTCHTRQSFVNGNTKDDTRHLLRIWVASEDERPLPDVFKWQWGTTEVGHRGGWQMPLGKGLAPHVPLEPCPPTHT